MLLPCRLLLRSCISTFIRHSSTVPKLTRTQPPHEQLKLISNHLLGLIRDKIRNNQLKYPYNELSQYKAPQIEELLEKFEDKLGQIFQKTPITAESIRQIGIADYFQPKLENIGPVIYAVHTGRYPSQLAQYRKYQLKSEVISDLLTDLLHQFSIERFVAQEKRNTPTWDLLAPAEWFPRARRMKRKIVMHVGPTNSGKTYHSLQALAKAKSGYYAGPLRLLAREVYERFRLEGKSCNLVTGEEVIPCLDDFGNVSEISAGTIEMIPLNSVMDICVIDEIQMIGDNMRGSAWTNAVLGVQAKEVHLCGEESAVDLIQRLVKDVGDEIEVRRYLRLGKLTVEDQPVGKLENLKKGDCLILFSKRKILERKMMIEQRTNLKVGVIYGALPPEIRSLEAAKFNNGEIDVLVASDAVGMGLNLKINRIVFGTHVKFDGTELQQLSVSAIKQIGGRAGRYSAGGGQLEGFVLALNWESLNLVKEAMNKDVENLPKAALWPPREYWSLYMNGCKRRITLNEAVFQFQENQANVGLKNYFFQDVLQHLERMQIFHRNNLSSRLAIEDQLTLMLIPINFDTVGPIGAETAVKFFEAIVACEPKTVFDFDFLHEHVIRLPPLIRAASDQIVQVLECLESDHRLILCFMWLSQRFPTVFTDRESAHEIKTLVEKRMIEELICLRKLSERFKPLKRSGNKNHPLRLRPKQFIEKPYRPSVAAS